MIFMLSYAEFSKLTIIIFGFDVKIFSVNHVSCHKYLVEDIIKCFQQCVPCMTEFPILITFARSNLLLISTKTSSPTDT